MVEPQAMDIPALAQETFSVRNMVDNTGGSITVQTVIGSEVTFVVRAHEGGAGAQILETAIAADTETQLHRRMES